MISYIKWMAELSRLQLRLYEKSLKFTDAVHLFFSLLLQSLPIKRRGGCPLANLSNWMRTWLDNLSSLIRSLSACCSSLWSSFDKLIWSRRSRISYYYCYCFYFAYLSNCEGRRRLFVPKLVGLYPYWKTIHKYLLGCFDWCWESLSGDVERLVMLMSK